MVLDREYERCRSRVLRIVRHRLRASFGEDDGTVVDAAYNQAWHAIYAKLVADESIEDLTALLITITYRRAIDELRRERWEHRLEPDEAASIEIDLDARIDDQTRMRHGFEAMRVGMDRREREAAVLCYVLGYSRREAATRLGVRPKRMEKIMDRVSGKLTRLAPTLDGRRWCDEQTSLIRSYALGLLDPDGDLHAVAAQHLGHCSACRRQVIVLRGLGAAIPPWPLLALAQGVAAGSVGASATAVGALRSPAWWQALENVQNGGFKLAAAASATFAVAGGQIYAETRPTAPEHPVTEAQRFTEKAVRLGDTQVAGVVAPLGSGSATFAAEGPGAVRAARGPGTADRSPASPVTSGSVLNGMPGGREEASEGSRSPGATVARADAKTGLAVATPTATSAAPAADPPKRTHLIERTESNPPITIKVPPIKIPLADLPAVELPEVRLPAVRLPTIEVADPTAPATGERACAATVKGLAVGRLKVADLCVPGARRAP